jgi:Flp pilus assembly pilin Flp
MRAIRSMFQRLLHGNDRGAVLVEYTAVFAFVSIGLTIAIVKLGPVLLVGWDTTRTVLLDSKP